MIKLKNLLLENISVFNLTKEDAQEILHKMGILEDNTDLQQDYNITQEQATYLVKSIPHQGGIWNVPVEFLSVIKGEMKDHINVMRDIANDAYNGGQPGQSLRINKQAIRFEKMFGI